MQILTNGRQEQLSDAYEDLKDELNTNKERKTIVIHVMSGHALHNEATGEATLFTNAWDQET